MNILYHIISVNFYGSLLILITFFIRTLFSKYLSREFIVFLWEIAILRLLIPNIFYSELSPWNTNLNSSTVTAISAFNTNIFSMIWICGFAFLFIFFSFVYINNIHKWKSASAVDNSLTAGWYLKHKEASGISIKKCVTIQKPLTYGIMKPVILLPSSVCDLDEKSIFSILEHEYQHIKNRDLFKKILIIFVLCIHWFNPFVWLLYHFLNKDLELLCDKKVISHLTTEERKTYALTLLLFSTKTPARNFSPELCKGSLKERIAYIVHPVKRNQFQLPLMLLCLLPVFINLCGKETINQNEQITISPSLPASNITSSESNKENTINYLYDTTENGTLTGTYTTTYTDDFGNDITIEREGKTLHMNFTTGEIIEK